MNLQDLRYLVALADLGHFGRAATACNVSQPTLSQQIKKLEDQIGVTLIERTNKSLHVTDVGEEVVARARQILLHVEAIGNAGRSVSGPLSGVFGLGVIPTLGPYILPWLVPALKHDYPSLRLVIREDLTAHLLERLVSHRLDAALVALPVSDERTETLPLFDEPFWFAEPNLKESRAGGAPTRQSTDRVSKSGASKGREFRASASKNRISKVAISKARISEANEPDVVETMKEDELRGKRLLLLTEGHCLRDQALAICGTTDQDGEEDFRATSLETIRQMVATGMGSTLLPAMACGDFRDGTVTARPLAGGIGRRIGLVWRRSYPMIPDLHLLARTLRQHLPPGVHPI